VFAINHRAAPRFHYPAAIDDVQRAIRFVRYHAREYGIDPARLGGVGGSSGGHLVGLAAMLSSRGDPADPDPVNRESATLQAVVLRAPITDLANIGTDDGMAFVVSFMELPPGDSPVSSALYAAASPVTHVNAKSPPVLLIHGDADKLVPFAQSTALREALESAGVPVRLVVVPGGEHGADFGARTPRADWPNYHADMVEWLNRHLGAR
jgi:acetyl esterase/lipase